MEPEGNASPSGGPTAEVVALEARRWNAVRARDSLKLEPLVADDLVYVHSNGRVETKASYLAWVKEGPVQIDDVRPRWQQEHRCGDAVVLVGQLALSVAVDEQSQVVELRYSSVWAHESGSWNFLSWHSTAVLEV